MRPAAIVIGGSRGLGRAVADWLATHGFDLILAARPSDALEEAGRTLRARSGGQVHELPVDVGTLDPAGAAAFVARCLELMPRLTQVYVTVGVNDAQDHGTASDAVLGPLMAVNAIGPCHLVAQFTERLRHTPANITVISSVAAVRGRRVNTGYAAAKRALETYVAGQRHETARDPLRLQIIRAGYIRSRMSNGKQLLLPPADPARLAATICRWHGDDYGIRYLPRYWVLIALGLRLAPWRVFRRLTV